MQITTHIIRRTPEIGIELPPHAIGKDWLNKGDLVGVTESRTGVQFSLFGVLGLAVGLGEGVEVNLLGLSMGVDFLRPAVRLPMLGRLGFRDKPVFTPEGEGEPNAEVEAGMSTEKDEELPPAI